MSARDFVKIIGLDGEFPEEGDNDTFEVFQGITSATSVDVSEETSLVPSTPISDDAEIAQALWEAQNALLEEESNYASELSDMFEEKREAVPKEENWWINLRDEILETLAAIGVGFIVTAITKNTQYGKLAAFLTEIGVSILLKKLKKLYEKAIDMCGAIQTENEALLALEMSRENYALRRETMKLHTEMLENVLQHIAVLEQMAQKTANLDMADMVSSIKALQYNNEELMLPGGGRLALRGKYIGG